MWYLEANHSAVSLVLTKNKVDVTLSMSSLARIMTASMSGSLCSLSISSALSSFGTGHSTLMLKSLNESCLQRMTSLPIPER